MMSNNAIVTSTLVRYAFSRNNQDILSALTPFVLSIITENYHNGDIIDCSLVKTQMKKEYSFSDIPLKVIEGILKRLCKNTSGNAPFLKKHNDGYNYIINKIPNQENSLIEFLLQKEKYEKDISRVLEEYKKYYESILGGQCIPERDFLSFFEEYGYLIINNPDSIDGIISKDKKKSLYCLARFLVDKQSDEDGLWDAIMSMTIGFMLMKVIYFSTQTVMDSGRLLEETSCYLDTKIALTILGYKTVYENESGKGLHNLLLKAKVKIKIFSHTLTEIRHIINQFKVMENAIQRSYTCEYFIEKKYSPIEITMIVDGLENTLRSLSIEICDTPPFSQDEMLKYDENKYREFLQKNSSEAFSQQGIDDDIKSVTSILRIRDKENSEGTGNIDRCKAIFVTTNYFLIENTKTFFDTANKSVEYKKELFEGLAVDDIFLTTLLWIKTGGIREPIKIGTPQMLLIANARAAMKITPLMLSEFKKTIEKFESEGTPVPSVTLTKLLEKTYCEKEFYTRFNGDEKTYAEFKVEEALSKTGEPGNKALPEHNEGKNEILLREIKILQKELEKQKELNALQVSINEELRKKETTSIQSEPKKVETGNVSRIVKRKAIRTKASIIAAIITIILYFGLLIGLYFINRFLVFIPQYVLPLILMLIDFVLSQMKNISSAKFINKNIKIFFERIFQK